jgi:hypothetical protein
MPAVVRAVADGIGHRADAADVTTGSDGEAEPGRRVAPRARSRAGGDRLARSRCPPLSDLGRSHRKQSSDGGEPVATENELVIVGTLERLLAAFNAHDIDAVMSFFADDCELGRRGPIRRGGA